MTVKVNYDTETTLVKGYYPDAINYALIPKPYIEISDEEHQETLGKQMCVINGVFQEYITPDNVLLEQAKIEKIAQCQLYLLRPRNRQSLHNNRCECLLFLMRVF